MLVLFLGDDFHLLDVFLLVVQSDARRLLALSMERQGEKHKE
jgi:hypothetical protein